MQEGVALPVIRWAHSSCSQVFQEDYRGDTADGLMIPQIYPLKTILHVMGTRTTGAEPLGSFFEVD